MCGRIVLAAEPDYLARIFEARLDGQLFEGWQPRWNVGPTSQIAGISDEEGGRVLAPYRWGLVPSWAADPSAFRSTFNARAETVASKPTFSTAFRHSRILIPVDGFFEWETLASNRKRPYVFTRGDGGAVVFAGLGDRWVGPGGDEIHSAAIITVPAGPDMPIHTRQPVVLEARDWDHWLDPDIDQPAALGPLLTASFPGTLVHHPVDPRVGSVANDGPELMDEVVPGDGPQLELPLGMADPSENPTNW